MQKIKEALAVSPLQREAFEREERASWREAKRMAAKGAGADERMDAAEAKRRRRQERNLLHCS